MKVMLNEPVLIQTLINESTKTYFDDWSVTLLQSTVTLQKGCLPSSKPGVTDRSCSSLLQNWHPPPPLLPQWAVRHELKSWEPCRLQKNLSVKTFRGRTHQAINLQDPHLCSVQGFPNKQLSLFFVSSLLSSSHHPPLILCSLHSLQPSLIFLKQGNPRPDETGEFLYIS